MNLIEAATFFNEIVLNCSQLEGVHFMIAPSILPRTIIEGYEIHLSGKSLDKETVEYLRTQAEKSNLNFETDKDAIGIFKAKAIFT